MGENIKIGELLTRAGVLREQDLNEAIQIAQDTGQMIGKVLIMSGYITRGDLQNALDAQSLIRDNQLEITLAVLAIATCSREKLTLGQALDQLGWHPHDNRPTARLGELLLASSMVTIDQLNKALDEMRENIVPLGTVLVDNGAITRSQLITALRIQEDIRSGKMTKTDGIKKMAIGFNQVAQGNPPSNFFGPKN